MDQEFQVAQFIQVANEQLTLCEEIVNYPLKMGKKNYDTVSKVDNFYKSACNAFFNDCVLIVGSLLNDKDKTIISLWNWPTFKSRKLKELTELTGKYSTLGFKTVRDQVVGHQDRRNANNNIPSSRRRGIIDKQLIKNLRKLLDEIIKEFCDASTEPTKIYKPAVYFSVIPTKEEVAEMLSKAVPVLTDNYVI